MASKIFKYPLADLGLTQAVQEIKSFSVFSPLKVALQNGVPMLWALVNDETVEQIFKVHIIGTGHECKFGISKDNYAGTFESGPFVWHVFIERI